MLKLGIARALARIFGGLGEWITRIVGQALSVTLLVGTIGIVAFFSVRSLSTDSVVDDRIAILAVAIVFLAIRGPRLARRIGYLGRCQREGDEPRDTIDRGEISKRKGPK